MPVILECECGHHTVRPNHTNSIRSSRCAKCGSAVLHRVKAQKATKVKSAAPPKPSSDKGGKQRPKVKTCPAATGCPQVPDCGGCAYAPVMPFAGLGHTVKAPHPMMAMQEGQTVAEAKAGTLTVSIPAGAIGVEVRRGMDDPAPLVIMRDEPEPQGRTEAEESRAAVAPPAPAVKVDQEQARNLIAKGRAHRVPKTPPPAAPARVDTAMLKKAWARVQARKGGL